MARLAQVARLAHVLRGQATVKGVTVAYKTGAAGADAEIYGLQKEVFAKDEEIAALKEVSMCSASVWRECMFHLRAQYFNVRARMVRVYGIYVWCDCVVYVWCSYSTKGLAVAYRALCL